MTYEKNITDSTYPGRGIVIGMTPDGKNMVQVYWIMGRSVNSKNRVFETDGNFMRTRAFDESKMSDPSLVIYYPIKNTGDYHIVTNGDQTDTIYDHIINGGSFESALETREFEPDPPNYTPRISGIINICKKKYKLSILKTINNDENHGQKNFYAYDRFIKGYGHCITTYIRDGNPLPSFTGEPYLVSLLNDIDDTKDRFWNYLNEDRKVSMAVKFIDVETGGMDIRIINKNS